VALDFDEQTDLVRRDQLVSFRSSGNTAEPGDPNETQRQALQNAGDEGTPEA
jgi:hypothetical protein